MSEEERYILLTCGSEVTWPADHPAWPVACGECGSRCLGAQVRFIRNDHSRGVAVTIWVCLSCMRYGAAESDHWNVEDMEMITPRLKSPSDPCLFLAGKRWSEKTGPRLPLPGVDHPTYGINPLT